MEMAVLRIAPLTGAPSITPDAIAELLKQRAGGSECLDHIQVRAGPESVLVFGFVSNHAPNTAVETLRRIVESTLLNTPELQLWRVL